LGVWEQPVADECHRDNGAVDIHQDATNRHVTDTVVQCWN
jgi:hypothetical protein